MVTAAACWGRGGWRRWTALWSLIAGMTSPVICRAVVRALKDRLPNAESVLVPDAGHMLPVTHPELTAALIAGSVSRG